ncbi:hypothetical protein HPP92_021474 [Vanilla planifolia]|uniref:Pentatricopeptide repeat-containing protein n=1 Tax=Vanilla planifolia TaxID=51239 RepID=A0A835UIT4_VANPL|nr:hypothetical protein HPP92_021474 [Vanilla planifolia]
MSLHRKRHGDIEYSRSTLGKRQHHRSPSLPRRGGGSAASDHRRPSFPSYHEVPDLPSKIRLLCKIIASSASLESSLDNSGVGISSEDVEEVLKLSYSHPASAVKFFRWAGHRLQHRHSPYSWNLVVDLLGKNLLFDAMWDAVHSMLAEGLVSLATFASIFSSFAAARRPADALAAFDTLPAHGVPQDVAALNSLLSALSRENLTASAYDFLHQNQHRIRPDADSYAILLEGFENERNRRGAREVFDEMVLSIGWDTSNIPAYDTFLNTLLFHSTGGLDEALRWLLIMKEHNCYPGKKFVRNAIEECIKLKDLRTATLLWDSLVGKNGCQPDTELYNSMISLFCHLNQMDSAFKFLDDMVPNGAFLIRGPTI